jgi:hypothetical protein
MLLSHGQDECCRWYMQNSLLPQQSSASSLGTANNQLNSPRHLTVDGLNLISALNYSSVNFHDS